jgi:signal recognition particle GTPase
MMMTPGAGMSPAQINQMLEQYRKMGMDPAQIQAMQQMMAGTPGGAAAAPAAEATQPDSSAH